MKVGISVILLVLAAMTSSCQLGTEVGNGNRPNDPDQPNSQGQVDPNEAESPESVVADEVVTEPVEEAQIFYDEAASYLLVSCSSWIFQVVNTQNFYLGATQVLQVTVQSPSSWDLRMNGDSYQVTSNQASPDPDDIVLDPSFDWDLESCSDVVLQSETASYDKRRLSFANAEVENVLEWDFSVETGLVEDLRLYVTERGQSTTKLYHLRANPQ